MPSLKAILGASALSLAGVGLIAVPADARTHHRKTGHTVRAQSRANSAAPGFNPDGPAKQSATGGQPGGAVGQE